MSIQVGKVIYNILTNNSEVVDKVQDKIFPLVAKENTTFPFIVYRRTGINPLDVKKKVIVKESANIQLVVATDSYNNGIEITELTRKILEGYKGECLGMKVDRIELVDADEDYIENTYIQTLSFRIDINK